MTVGRTVSICTLVKAVDGAVVVPPNVCVAVIEYVPSSIVPNVQDPVVPLATNVQVTAVPDAGVAVSVTVAPDVNPPILIVGVLSLVILSVLKVPVSEVESRVGVPVAASAPIAIVRVKDAKIGVSDFPPNSYSAFIDWVLRSTQYPFA